MTNLERDVAAAVASDLDEAAQFPSDVERLKREIPELAMLPDSVVDHIYSEWSEEEYCAGWLILDYGLTEFAAYLREPAD